MNGLWKKIAAAGLTAVMGVSMFAGCGKKDAKLDGTKTVITVNDEQVSLGAVSFMSRYQQAYMYQLYSSYFGSSEIFDQVVDESSEKTYGDQMKESVVDSLEEMVLLKQHASEYDVKITDDQKKEFEKIAQAYIDENKEEIRDEIGASREDVIYLLELQTIQSLMRAPMTKDVDTDIPDEDAQQTTVTYVSIEKVADEEDAESGEEVPAETGTDESTSDEAEEETTGQKNAELKKNAEQILENLKKEKNIAEVDMSDIAAEVDPTYSAISGQFTTNDPADTTLDAKVVEAVSGLKDGELCDKVIETDTHYYVVRLDENFAKTETESKKKELQTNRKSDAYKEIVEKWKKAAEITVDDKALSLLLITDKDTYVLGQDKPEDTSTADESMADESLADTAVADSAAQELDDASEADGSDTESLNNDESSADESAAAESN